MTRARKETANHRPGRPSAVYWGTTNARCAKSRRSVILVPEFRRYVDEPASAPHGARAPAEGTPLALHAEAGRGAAPLRKTAMGTSLLWQTDTELHDSLQRQLEWGPEIDAHDVAVTTHSAWHSKTLAIAARQRGPSLSAHSGTPLRRSPASSRWRVPPAAAGCTRGKERRDPGRSRHDPARRRAGPL